MLPPPCSKKILDVFLNAEWCCGAAIPAQHRSSYDIDVSVFKSESELASMS